MKDLPLDERKLEYTHFSKAVEPSTPSMVCSILIIRQSLGLFLTWHSQITKSISRFLAQNRARNDASNRNEFLLSLAEKKRQLQESADGSALPEPGPSCARTDAKTQNRDVQMKYDIAKNEDGPLRKTMKRGHDAVASDSNPPATTKKQDEVSADRYPALDERLRNIETHVAVLYGELWPIVRTKPCVDTGSQCRLHHVLCSTA